MIKLKIIAVGKLKENFYTAAIDEFSKRLSRYAEIEFVEIPDEKAPDKMSNADLERLKSIEGEKILSRITDNETVILTDLRGKQLSSVELAERISDYMVIGKSRLTFIIGGSNGVSNEVFNRADFKLCFSKMTFSHQIFRVMLLEQLYRSFKIINGEPYHK